ncbi:lytic transglycosylase domain-containing protein [Actinocrispum wychmicini]|uniref:Transglycosylase protein with SLT domain n=1 Tax=Actinocrispum wychmicini TaxID=1213861 RepID=A0A4R2JQT9_9PSEU|nr:transglycosylase protein with SLT domain [Actinocrispum wychmicini]
MRGRGLFGRLLLVVLVLAAAGGGVWLLSSTSAPAAGPVTTEIPALQVQPAQVQPGAVAPASEVIPQGTAQGKDPLVAWADRVAKVTGVPARALVAYGNAELVLRSTTPSCHVSWATLAGIGRIESNHGQFGGAVLGADGRPSKPIVGVPLDGSVGVQRIGDTDRGQYDGDPTLDRAVGPMQFIPSTWAKWASDGNGDGRGDPQQIDDAALAAARYLCAGGRDLATASGWWAGVLSYNNSETYGQKVFGLADGYARDAQHA